MSRPRIRVVSAEIVRNGSYLLTQRLATAVLPHLWEFPGGRVQGDETDQAALARALDSRIGCTARIGECVMEVTHPYAEYDLTLVVYRCDLGLEEPSTKRVAAVAWVSPDRFAEYPFPGADQKTIDQLLGTL